MEIYIWDACCRTSCLHYFIQTIRRSEKPWSKTRWGMSSKYLVKKMIDHYKGQITYKKWTVWTLKKIVHHFFFYKSTPLNPPFLKEHCVIFARFYKEVARCLRCYFAKIASVLFGIPSCVGVILNPIKT